MLEFFRELGIPDSEWEDKGLDIKKTPHRMAKMLRDEILVSYKPGSLEELRRRFTCFDSDGEDGMVFEGPIDFHSTCAHHLLPFSGQAYVAYIPDRKLVGASKLPRVVEHFARMLQIQERLGRQVAEFIHEEAEARLVIVLMSAIHLCMRCRGVKQQNTKMITTAVRPQPTGEADAEWRGVLQEFYYQLQFSKP
jgi:GTP cyclohydrolase I